MLDRRKGTMRACTAGLIAAMILSGGASCTRAQAAIVIKQQIALPGYPFGVITTPDGRFVFASLSGLTNGIAVLARDNDTYQLIHVVPTEASAAGLTINRDGTLLFAALPSQGVAFINVERAIIGAPGAVIGYQSLGSGAGTIELHLSRDERLMFASNENIATVSVIDVREALHSDFGASAVVGQIPVERAPVGLALSPDGEHLFVTNEAARPGTAGYDPAACAIPTAVGGGTIPGPQGTITIADVRRAAVDPATSVVARAYAGCTPVRLALSPGGDIAWVSARASDQLEAFSTARLLADPAHALIATTPVGTAPVGVQLFADGRLVAVANSNRFATAHGTVSVVDAAKALAGKAATVQTIDVGNFPREWARSPDGRSLYLTEFMSSTLDVFALPDHFDAIHRARD